MAEVNEPPQVLMMKGRPGVLCQSESELGVLVLVSVEVIGCCDSCWEARVGVVVVRRVRSESMVVRDARVGAGEGAMANAGVMAGDRR